MHFPLVAVLEHRDAGLVREGPDTGHRPAQPHACLGAVPALGEVQRPGVEAGIVQAEPIRVERCPRGPGRVGLRGSPAIASGLPVGEKGLHGLAGIRLERSPNDPDGHRSRH